MIPSLTLADLIREAGAGEPAWQRLQRSIQAVRRHLDMDVAFVSQFADGRRWFRAVDAADPGGLVQVGGSDPLEETFCQRVVDGRLPQVMPDARLVQAALELPVTQALPVGGHISVPIRLVDGELYGTLCCFSHTAQQLGQRDLAMMRVFAAMAGELIDYDIQSERSRFEAEARIASVLEDTALSMVYQPIYHVAERRIVGFESLARFSAEPRRTPDVWFNEAVQIGRAVELESMAIRLALKALPAFPEEVYVAVNVSPETIVSGALAAALAGHPVDRVVLEVTEHASISHYGSIAAAVEPLRRAGLRIAVDDAGAGYASFRHILSLAPDIIKLDISITRNIDSDPSRRELGKALIGFAEATGSRIVAEGVETAGELAVLRELGVNKAQGYFIGKPMQAADAAAIAGRPLPLPAG